MQDHSTIEQEGFKIIPSRSSLSSCRWQIPEIKNPRPEKLRIYVKAPSCLDALHVTEIEWNHKVTDHLSSLVMKAWIDEFKISKSDKCNVLHFGDSNSEKLSRTSDLLTQLTPSKCATPLWRQQRVRVLLRALFATEPASHAYSKMKP